VFVDYPPGYFPDASRKLGVQPDLTANTSSTHTSSLLFPEYVHLGSTASKDPISQGIYYSIAPVILVHSYCDVYVVYI